MELGRPSLRALLDYWEQRDSMKQTEQKSPPQTEYREEPQDADMSPSSPRSPSLMSHGNGETSLSPLAAVEDFGAEVSDRLETVTSALSIICDQESVRYRCDFGNYLPFLMFSRILIPSSSIFFFSLSVTDFDDECSFAYLSTILIYLFQ